MRKVRRSIYPVKIKVLVPDIGVVSFTLSVVSSPPGRALLWAMNSLERLLMLVTR